MQENVGELFGGLVERTAEGKQRCRTALQSRADAPMPPATQSFPQTNHVDFTLALV